VSHVEQSLRKLILNLADAENDGGVIADASTIVRNLQTLQMVL
jgi:hypothetical protein